MPARTKAFTLLILVAAIWGLAPPVIKQVLHYLPVGVFLTYRFFLTLLVFVPLLFILEPKIKLSLTRLQPKDWAYLTLSGLLGSTIQLGLLFAGLALTTALDGSIINATSPIFVAFGGYFFLKEKLSPHILFGLVIAFAGSVLIVLQPIFASGLLFSGSLLGNLLVLAGTIAWAGYALLVKTQLKHRLSPLFLTTFMFFVGFLTFSFLTFIQPQTRNAFFTLLESLPLSIHLEVAFMAFISGGLAYWLFQIAESLVPATQANIFLYLSPLFTIPISHLWLGEPLTLPFVLGAITITIGVFLAEFSRTRLHHI